MLSPATILVALFALTAVVLYAGSRWYYHRRFISTGLLPRESLSEVRYSRFLDGVDPRIRSAEHKSLVQNARRCRQVSAGLFSVAILMALVLAAAAVLGRFL